MRKPFTVLLGLVAAASLAVNLYLFQRYSTSRPLLRMENDTISIKEYRDSLEYQFGKTTLTKITFGKIVLNAAKKGGVYPADKEVDSRLVEIQRSRPDQLEMARMDAVRMSELRQDLKTDIALENLTIKETKVSEVEVQTFYKANEELFTLPMQSRTLIVRARNRIDAATAEALMKQANMTPEAIASTQPRLGVVGITLTPNWDTLPAESRARLSRAVTATPVGSVVQVPVQDSFYIVRVDRRAVAEVLPYRKARMQAERLARLAKAPPRTVVLARLYRDANVRFEIPRYADFFRGIEAAPK